MVTRIVFQPSCIKGTMAITIVNGRGPGDESKRNFRFREGAPPAEVDRETIDACAVGRGNDEDRDPR